MFKAGDKGRTRAGWNYLITRIDLGNYFGPWHQPIFASIDGGHEQCFGVDGTFNPCCPDNDFDLLPPESHEEVEMPEYSTIDTSYGQYSLTELLIFAAEAARDNPDCTFYVDAEAGTISVHAD